MNRADEHEGAHTVSTHNTSGVEYAKLSETKEGDTLIADGDFTCMAAGPHVVKSSEDGLWVACSEGVHLLTGGDCADGDHIIGFTKPAAIADKAPPEMLPVVSSNIASVGHDGTDLFVAFKSGGAYRYQGVPVITFDAMRAAKSAGSYLHANIKGKFTAVKVEVRS